MANDFRRGIKVYLDAQEYKEGITEMIKATEELEKELQNLAAKGESLAKKEIQQKARLEKTIQSNTKSIADFKRKNEETEKVLNNLSGATFTKLRAVQNQLKRELKDTERGSEAYKNKLMLLKKVTKETVVAQKEMEVQIGCNANIFGRATSFVNKYWAMLGAGLAAITGVSMKFRQLAEDVAHMDDVYADVMKTTNLTHNQVKSLNDELKKMDTRTGREELNKLASEAGKLGIEGSKNILDFVDAGNQIRVALGEDLGEDAIKNIGKMVGVFDKSTKHLQGLGLKEQMLAVGSAINQLGASSSASEDYLVQFAGRLGGVASQAGISIDAILGFGSALDQDMQQVEMSATALQNFIMKIMGEPAKFAKLAGKDVKEFTALLQTDANAAIKDVLRSLNAQGGFQQLIPIFNEMGLDGARAVGVLSSMASSIDKIDEAQRVANQSLTEGTSVTKEYNVKNDNLQARLDKARKAFKEVSLELGESLNPILLKSTNVTSYLIKGLVELIKNWDKAAKLLVVIAGYMVAYNAKLLVNNLLLKEGIGLKIKELALKAKDNVVLQYLILKEALYAATKDKTTLATKAAAIAQVLWNNAIKANPIGFFIGLLTTAVGLIWAFKEKTTAAEKATESFYDDLAREQSSLQSLMDEYRNINTTKERKIEIIKQLQTQYGAYLDDLLNEEGLLINVEAAQLRANKALQDNLALKGKQKFIDDAQEDFFKNQLKNVDKFKDAMKDAGMSEYQVGAFASKINTMFRDSGADVNQTMRLAVQYMEDNGVKVNNAMRKSMQAMVKTANQMNVAKREADETFDVFLSDGNNVLNEVVITPPKSKPKGGGKPPAGSRPAKDKTKANEKDPAEASLKELEDAQKAELLTLKNSLINKEITEKEFAERGAKILKTHLDNKLLLQKFWGKSTIDTEIEIADWKLRQQKTDDELLLDDIRQANESKLAALSEFDALQKEQLQDRANAGFITQKQYNEQLIAIELTTAQSRKLIAEDYLKFVQDTEFSTLAAKEKALDEAKKAVDTAAKAETEANKKAISDKLKADEDYQKERKALLERYGLVGVRGQYAAELKELKQSLDKKLLTEEEFEKAKKKLKLKYAEQGAQTAVQFAGYVADAVSAYHQMEADSLEAEKQRELEAAGDNAEARKEIEQEYARKELDLKKKQANADAGIKIAQTIAAGALAAIQAFAQLGPIGGAIAAALIAVTTGFQIASIIKQRNAIMATTLESSGAGGAAQQTGKLVTKQAAGGRYDVIGAADGITYRNVPYTGVARSGMVRTPTLVAERGDELIVSHPHLHNIRMNAPHLLHELMRYRVPQRAEGNYGPVNQPQGGFGESGLQNVVEKNTAVMRQTAALLKDLKENGVKAPVVISEFERKQALQRKSEKIGSQ